MTVPADEQRLREIAVLADELIAYADEDDRLIHTADASYVMQLIADVPWLLALLRVRDAAVREAAELRDALREIAKGESYYVGDYMNIARAALEATE